MSEPKTHNRFNKLVPASRPKLTEQNKYLVSTPLSPLVSNKNERRGKKKKGTTKALGLKKLRLARFYIHILVICCYITNYHRLSNLR